MAGIEEYLGDILSARYGEEVRQSIHDAIHQCYEDGKAGATDLVAREQIANLVANEGSTGKDSELVDIRVGYDGTNYTSAGESVRDQSVKNFFNDNRILYKGRVVVSGTSPWNAEIIEIPVSEYGLSIGHAFFLKIGDVTNNITEVCVRFEGRKNGANYQYVEMSKNDIESGSYVQIGPYENNVIDTLRVSLYRNYSEEIVEVGDTTFSNIVVTIDDVNIIGSLKENVNLKKNADFIKLTQEKASYWYGKKIVWFGTSIPAGSYDDNLDHAYPKIVGKILDAIVYNESVGSSSISRTLPSKITEENPYGFDTYNFEFAARCLGDSLEKKEWLINNYNNSDVFTSEVPKEMTEQKKEIVRDYSYERKLDRYLEGGEIGNVDLYVFDQGYNDNFHDRNDEELEETYGVDTAYCYDGGMNFLIRRILKNNPDAKIAIISHYTDNATDVTWSSTKHVEDLRDAQKKIANRWGIKWICLFDILGWSGEKINTTGYWDSLSNTWINTGGTEHEMQIKDIHVRDTVHPYTDASGKSNNRIAEIIAEEINKIR